MTQIKARQDVDDSRKCITIQESLWRAITPRTIFIIRKNVSNSDRWGEEGSSIDASIGYSTKILRETGARRFVPIERVVP